MKPHIIATSMKNELASFVADRLNERIILEWAVTAVNSFRENPENFVYNDFEKEFLLSLSLSDRARIHDAFLEIDSKLTQNVMLIDSSRMTIAEKEHEISILRDENTRLKQALKESHYTLSWHYNNARPAEECGYNDFFNLTVNTLTLINSILQPKESNNWTY